MKLKDVWKESYDQPRQHIKKQRHYFADKGPSSQSYGFSGSHVWIWELDYKESWAPKNLCFQTVLLGKTVEILLDSKEIKPVNPKEINPEYSLEGLKLKLQHFGHLMLRADSLEKTLMLGKIEGRRRKGQQKQRQLDGITNSMDMNFSKLQEMLKDGRVWLLQFMGSQRIRHDWATEQQFFLLIKCLLYKGQVMWWAYMMASQFMYHSYRHTEN